MRARTRRHTPERLEHHVARFAVVIDDQDPDAVESRHIGWLRWQTRRPGFRASRAVSGASLRGSSHDESCARITAVALGAHGSAMKLDEVTNDRQAETKTAYGHGCSRSSAWRKRSNT